MHDDTNRHDFSKYLFIPETGWAMNNSKSSLYNSECKENQFPPLTGKIKDAAQISSQQQNQSFLLLTAARSSSKNQFHLSSRRSLWASGAGSLGGSSAGLRAVHGRASASAGLRSYQLCRAAPPPHQPVRGFASCAGPSRRIRWCVGVRAVWGPSTRAGGSVRDRRARRRRWQLDRRMGRRRDWGLVLQNGRHRRCAEKGDGCVPVMRTGAKTPRRRGRSGSCSPRPDEGSAGSSSG
uniref:Uncharacterized protein n=1 Tax=Setaria viridis TaxID=4556 RepID=A0A4V6D739_SETVI|nr:hypothetical protein SEVIR_5G322600v2 [Setaria viridis]